MKRKLYGQVTIEVMLTVVGMAAVVIFYGMNYVNNAIAPVAAQSQQNREDIASIQTDISWIKGALQAHGFRPDSTSSQFTRQ